MKKFLLSVVAIGVVGYSCTPNDGQKSDVPNQEPLSSPSLEDPDIGFMYEDVFYAVSEEQIGEYFSSISTGETDFTDFDLLEDEGRYFIHSCSIIDGSSVNVAMKLEYSEPDARYHMTGETCSCASAGCNEPHECVPDVSTGCGCSPCAGECTKTSTVVDQGHLYDFFNG